MSYAISADRLDQSPCVIFCVCGGALDSVEELHIVPDISCEQGLMCCQVTRFIGLCYFETRRHFILSLPGCDIAF